MEFTRSAYRDLLHRIRNQGYQFSDFLQKNYNDDIVILRHDIDFSLRLAAELSDIEADEGVTSTYFALVNTDFYNVCSQNSKREMNRILKNGSSIGLHFDESQYEQVLQPLRENSFDEYLALMNEYAEREKGILESIIETPVKAIAFHCPSQESIQADIDFKGMANAYGNQFFKQFKYLSDSRMNWREDVDTIIAEHRYQKLQILTHAFWYPDKYMDMKTHLKKLCCDAVSERYHSLNENFANLQEVLLPGDIEL